MKKKKPKIQKKQKKTKNKKHPHGLADIMIISYHEGVFLVVTGTTCPDGSKTKINRNNITLEMENDMYHIVICDDEPKILEDLSDIIKTIFSKLNISVEYYITQDAKSLLEHISETNIDILFLDIDMPKHSGMEVADYLVNQGSKTLLIFVTNYEALVYQSFQYHPFGFIRKNYFSEEIEGVISSAVNVLKDRQDTISIKMNNKLIRIKLSEIIYFEADSNYVNVFTTTATYYYRESLGVLEKQLSDKGFIRIHKGYLINQQFVYAIRYNEVELLKVGLLPIGRSNRENVRKLLMKYMR